MTITQDNYLDLWHILVNEVVGDAGLFIILGVVFIAYISLKNRLGIEATTTAIVLFLLAVSATVLNEFVLMITILIVGLIYYLTLAKVWKR